MSCAECDLALPAGMFLPGPIGRLRQLQSQARADCGQGYMAQLRQAAG